MFRAGETMLRTSAEAEAAPFQTLDVGCGENPRGNVNCDQLYLAPAENFVKLDLNKPLPFKDKSFNQVIACHVLEHLENPLFSLEEWKRVATKKVVVYVPDLKEFGAVGEHWSRHYYTWSFSSLQYLMEHVFPRVEVYSNRRFVMWKRKDTFIERAVGYVLTKFLSRLDFICQLELIGIGFCK